MAGTSLFALLDDIASILDDVATMTKVATKKTAGVLGDDLALNAEQVSGVKADRELSVVWGVAKGSAKNKLILVPSALLLGTLAPWAVTPLLMLGGAFLCFEGFEKVAHKLLHSKEELQKEKQALAEAVVNPEVDLVELEKEKIKGAIRTVFILSAEIIVISLGSMANATMTTRIAALVAVAVIMTVGVYGLVAGIVKLDDAGLALSKRGGGAKLLGRFLLCPPADEGSNPGWHGRDVPRRWRHPRARNSAPAPRRRGLGRKVRRARADRSDRGGRPHWRSCGWTYRGRGHTGNEVVPPQPAGRGGLSSHVR